jgi:hypothetical protein
MHADIDWSDMQYGKKIFVAYRDEAREREEKKYRKKFNTHSMVTFEAEINDALFSSINQ